MKKTAGNKDFAILAQTIIGSTSLLLLSFGAVIIDVLRFPHHRKAPKRYRLF